MTKKASWSLGHSWTVSPIFSALRGFANSNSESLAMVAEQPENWGTGSERVVPVSKIPRLARMTLLKLLSFQELANTRKSLFHFVFQNKTLRSLNLLKKH